MKRTWIIPCLAVSNLTITTSSPLPTGEVTQPYFVNFGAAGGTAPYTWLSIGALPAGLSLSPTGQLTGTPTAFYSSSFQVQVTDAALSQFTAVFNLTIVLQVAIATTSPLPAATESNAYAFTMSGTRGVAPYSWVLLSQSGSNAWVISPSGVITGTPNFIETDVLNIQIIDSLGVTNSGVFNLQVNAVFAAVPTFAPTAGTYPSSQTVTISCSTPSSSIYYTTDGSTPTFPVTGTTLHYTAPLTVSVTETIKAIGVAAGLSNSTVASATYTIGSGSFDFYIAPNGDDNNAGTLASPWSITALNSKQSIYSPPGVGGKRIGIIGDVAGTQTPLKYGTVGGIQTTLYSLMGVINSGNQSAALKVNGGNSTASVYLGSCTSSGVYRVGWAIFDASNSSGVAPVGPNAIILGQPFYASANTFPNNGYVTLDGLSFTNFNYAAVIFGDVQTTTLPGIVIQNCKFFNGVCSTGNENPGMIFLGSAQNAQITNCLFKNGQTTGGTNDPYGMAGIASYNKTTVGSNHTVTNCTFIQVGYSIRAKDNNQWGTYSYNYMDCGLFASACNTAGQNQNPIKGAIAPNGQTLTVHHNIILGGGYWGWGEDGTLYGGAANFYNNTFYTPPAVTALALGVWFKSLNSSTGPIVFQNNLTFYETYYNNQGGPFATFSYQSGFGISSTSLDYNYYGTGASFGTNNNVTLSGWQGLGFEPHSISGGNPFSGTPASGVPTSFAITGAALTASSTGGPVGALDGTGSIGSTLT